MAARILIMAGGTGGHVYPGLAVARELRDRGCDIVWMGTRAGMEAKVVPAAGIPIEWLSVAGFRGKGWFSKLRAPFNLIRACWQAFRILRRLRPDVVLGMGGFVAGPGGIMARLLRIPLIVHEQNRIPGTTNRLLVKFAAIVLEAFPASFKPAVGARCVGNPLRREIVDAVTGERSPPDESLKVLVVGGSQGAQALNRIVPEAFVNASGSFRVWHQTGEAMRSETEARYREAGVDARVAAFIDDMAEAYRWADVAVCRAGAMTVSELAAAGLPAILVPFPFAIDDHQSANARYLAEAGAAWLIPQADLTPERLSSELTNIAHNPSVLPKMSHQCKALARPQSAREVADICLAEVSS